MVRYYEFPKGGGSWIKETVEHAGHGECLTRRQYSGDPRVKGSDARLDNLTQFDAATEESAHRFRQGFVLGDGQLDWQPWEPV